MEPTSSNSSSTTSPQSKYLSDRSFSITLIIFHQATASRGPDVPHSDAPHDWQVGVVLGIGLGIPTAIVLICGCILFVYSSSVGPRSISVRLINMQYAV